MVLQEISQKIIPILRANGVEYAAIFGSVARGEAGSKSDVDVLIRYTKTPGLFDHIGLMQTLEDVLHTKVDLVTEKSLRDFLAPFVKTDMHILYGKTKR